MVPRRVVDTPVDRVRRGIAPRRDGRRAACVDVRHVRRLRGRQRLEVLERQRVVVGIEGDLVPVVGELRREVEPRLALVLRRARRGRRRSGGSSAGPGSPGARGSCGTRRRRTYGLMIAAAISGWFGTLTALPMSCSSDANTTSSSAPARSARVAVCSECVSWSTAKPSVIVGQRAQHAEHALGDPVLVLVGLLADHRPLLGGRLVHAGEGLRHAPATGVRLRGRGGDQGWPRSSAAPSRKKSMPAPLGVAGRGAAPRRSAPRRTGTWRACPSGGSPSHGPT